jgi:glycosyltransferase involved in cell wall biosynthesis
MTPLVSIIIRARDEEASLRRLIPLLREQHTDFEYEVWLLDNQSHDASAALTQAAGWQYHFIPRGAFNYATALNQGAALARGEIVVNLSAHCFPQHAHWLAELVQPLREDAQIVASYGRQSADPLSSPFEALGNDTVFPPAGRQPVVMAFSNANGAVRREYLLHHPFNAVIGILEDHLFLLELGPNPPVAYAPQALVLHEHERFSLRYYLRRWLREGWSFYYITHYRKLESPFAHKPLLNWRDLVLGYARLAASFAKRGRISVALLTVPFFYLRDLTWLIGHTWARLNRWRMR